MTRIEGVPRSKAGPLVRLISRMTRRKAKQIAGADRELGIEPVEIYAHLPGCCSATGCSSRRRPVQAAGR